MSEADVNKLIEKVKQLKAQMLKLTEKNEEIYGHFYSNFLTIQKQLEDYQKTCTRLPTPSPELLGLMEVKKKVKELGFAARGYVMDYFLANPKAEYPFLIPNYLSEMEGKHQVAVFPIDRIESIDTFMVILTPGSFIFIYGFPFKKSLLGPWTPSYPTHPSCVVRATPSKKIPRNKLPEEAPYDKEFVDMEIPKEIRLKDIPEKEGFQACTVCGSIIDGTGDENCSHPACWVRIKTVPKIYPLINTYVDRAEDIVPINVTVPYPFNEIFPKILFSRKLFVTRFLYGAERSFLNQLWKVYFDPVYGYDMETRGIDFSLSQGKIRSILTQLPEFLNRNLMVLYFIHKLSNLLKFYGGTISDARLVFSSILGIFARKEKFPLNNHDFKEMFNHATKNEQELIECLNEIIRIYFGERTPACYGGIKSSLPEILSNLAKFENEEFQEFVYNIFVHTLKHYIYLASMLTVGVGSSDLSAHFSTENIHIFDDAEMGNGCSETLSSMIYVPYEKRITSILSSSAKHELGMHAEDLIDTLEELLLGCQSEKLGKIYCDFIRTIPLSEIENFVKHPQRIKDLIKGKVPEALASSLYGLMKQPIYVHEVIKLVNSYDNVWIYQMFPELFLLLRGKEIKSIKEDGRLERIIDALSLCIDGCPNCVFLDKCSYGSLSSRFYLSRKLVEHIYNELVERATVFMDDVDEKTAEHKIKEISSKYNLIYFRCSGKHFSKVMVFLNKILAKAETGKCFLTHVHVEPDEYIFKLTFERGET